MSPADPYPVMVFFHGGAYQSGAGIQYPGHFLSARDIILVVPNYRMGIIGKEIFFFKFSIFQHNHL